ncbi:TonB-dependent receptor [Hyphomonas oceanitis]|uniref:TonB-dependent receptor n=1 Tax=Hyphomonas oceanitis TaxID=81033 RepID=UPI003001D7C5
MKRTSRSAVCMAALFGVSAAGALASAQENETRKLDTVIVTAQKKSESVQDVAAAISALDGAALEDRGISDVEDLQFVVPGLEVGTLRVGGTNITIRGVGLNQGSPGVAVHVDGAYQTSSAMADLAQIDLERVEVLRGPQGTLYGRNANGGVVNFITRKPQDVFTADFLAGYAEYDESHLQTVLNAPVTDQVRSRLVVDYSRRGEGFTKNIAGGQDLDAHDTLAGRASLGIDLSEAATLDISLSGYEQTGPTSSFQLASLPSAAALAANPFLANANVSLKPRTTTANDPSSSDRKMLQGNATLDWDLGVASLKSISSYTSYTDMFQTDSDSTDISAFLQTNRNGSNTFTQEVNLSGSGATLDWVVGAFYLNENAKRRLYFSFPSGQGTLPPGTYLLNNAPVSNTDAYAVFGDATWHVTDRLSLITGVRYSEEKQDYKYSGEIGFLVGDTQIPFLPLCPARTDTASFSSFTPRGGVQYDLAGDQNIYATVSKGFKAGGVNLNSCGNEYDPEKITAYEAGYRSQWQEAGLTFNATGFYYDYTDLQLSQVTGLINLVTNAAAAEVKGIELETAWNPTSNLSLTGNLSWLDAKYSSFVNVDTLNPGAGPQDVAGNRLSNSPEWSANLGAALSTEPGPRGRLTGRVELSYRSKAFFREFNLPVDTQDAYSLVNAALIWEDASETYTVRLYAKNLTDEDYVAQGGSSDAFGTLAITYGAPRQVGLELRARY